MSGCVRRDNLDEAYLTLFVARQALPAYGAGDCMGLSDRAQEDQDRTRAANHFKPQR